MLLAESGVLLLCSLDPSGALASLRQQFYSSFPGAFPFCCTAPLCLPLCCCMVLRVPVCMLSDDTALIAPGAKLSSSCSVEFQMSLCSRYNAAHGLAHN